MTEYKIDHYGITVVDLDRAAEWYRTLGFEETRRADKPDLRLRLAIMELKGSKLELIEPHENPLNTPLHKPGTQHIAFSVDNLIEAYDQLRENGAVFIDELHTRGAYFCTFPGSLIEIKERK